jgi:hypothetical protein
MKTLNTAYVAGFIDGEAYIGLMKRKYKLSPRPFLIKPTVKIAQIEKYKDVLEYLKDHYGGYISKTREHHNSRPSVMWELANKQHIRKLMEDIKPYVIVKKEVVEIMLEYCDLPKQTNSLSEINNEIYDRKIALQERTAQLTRRGLAETE